MNGMKAKIGDLVRHTNIPSFGVGLITGRKEGSAGLFVRWLDPKRATCKTSMEIDLMLEVVNENNENR
jgi:hypothetical protein